MKSTALTTVDTEAIAPFHGDALDRAYQLSDAIAESPLLPEALRGNPANVLVTILAGHELGIGPMASIRGIHVVQGKPVLGADMMVALAQRDPACKYFRLVASTDRVAEYETHRAGSPKPVRMSYTIEQAVKGDMISKSTWRHHPAAMLRARASAALARAVYPDKLFGVYADGEIIDAVDAEIVDADIDIAAAREQIAAASTADELDAVAEAIAGLTDRERTELRVDFAKRKRELATGRSQRDAIKARGRKVRQAPPADADVDDSQAAEPADDTPR